MTKLKLVLNKLKVLKLHFKKLGLLNLVSYFLQRIFRAKNSPIIISMAGIQHPFLVRNTPSDTQIFTQIFLREELKINLESSPKYIIDGGANIGLATLYLRNQYPDAIIFAVEPDKANFEMLVNNTRLYKNVFCYQNGIWNKRTKLKIINKEAGSESFVIAEADPGDHYDIIDAITINDIVRQHQLDGIDLLKLDIEGSELKVFQDNYIEWLSITDNMLVEIHNWINKETEKTVSKAVEGIFKTAMAGEYHYYSRIKKLNRIIPC